MAGSTDQAQIYAGTPDIAVLDNRGLSVRALQLNRREAADAVDVQVTRSVFDAAGFPQTVTDPRLGALADAKSNFRFTTGLGGQTLHVDGVDNGETTVFFDIEGRVIWQRDARQTVMTFTYDALGRVTETWQQLAGETAPVLIGKILYGDNDPGLPRAGAQAANLCGAPSKQWDTAGYGETTGISLSGQPQVQSRKLLAKIEGDPDWSKDSASQLETTAYVTSLKANAIGVVLQQIDALGNQHDYGYDVALRLTQSQLTEKDGTSPQVLLKSMAYNANGQIAEEIAGNDAVTTYTYEPQTQRLIRLTTDRPDKDPQGLTRRARLQDLNYDYDPVGNILSINDAAQATRFYRNQAVVPQNLYQYDALYQLVEATGRENATAASLTTVDLPPIVPLPNDLSVLTSYKRQYQYDRGGNLTQIQHMRAANGYTRNIVVAAASNRAMMQTLSTSLTPAGIDGSYFDACGNALQLQPGSAQPLAWNGRNALQSVTLIDRALPAQSDREIYQNDGGGQRIRKTMLRYKDDGQSYQRDTVIYLPGVEIRRSETVSTARSDQPTLSEELHVLSPDNTGRAGVQRLSWRAGRPQAIPANQTRYSFGNQIGSVTLELDQSASILTFEEYYPFGGTAVSSAANESEAKYKFIRYSGKEKDATGLYYYGLRYYQPWIGRWLNTDPAGTVDGPNLYRMVKNNPINFNDPDGRALENAHKIDVPLRKKVLYRAVYDREASTARIGGRIVERDVNGHASRGTSSLRYISPLAHVHGMGTRGDPDQWISFTHSLKAAAIHAAQNMVSLNNINEAFAGPNPALTAEDSDELIRRNHLNYRGSGRVVAAELLPDQRGEVIMLGTRAGRERAKELHGRGAERMMTSPQVQYGINHNEVLLNEPIKYKRILRVYQVNVLPTNAPHPGNFAGNVTDKYFENIPITLKYARDGQLRRTVNLHVQDITETANGVSGEAGRAAEQFELWRSVNNNDPKYHPANYPAMKNATAGFSMAKYRRRLGIR